MGGNDSNYYSLPTFRPSLMGTERGESSITIMKFRDFKSEGNDNSHQMEDGAKLELWNAKRYTHGERTEEKVGLGCAKKRKAPEIQSRTPHSLLGNGKLLCILNNNIITLVVSGESTRLHMRPFRRSSFQPSF